MRNCDDNSPINYNPQFTDYLKELSSSEFDVLSRKEEFELITAYRVYGDEKARDELIKHNLRLVPYIVKKFKIYTSDPMDLVQAGNVGLLEAIDNFDIEKNVRVGTYAIYTIKKHILGVVTDDLNKVYIPFGMTYKIGRYRQLMLQAEKQGIEYTDEEIMKELKIDNLKTWELFKKAVSIEYVSTNTAVKNTGANKITIEDLIEDDNGVDFDSPLIEEDNHKYLLEALGKLSDREYDIITHLYSYGCEKVSTKELAKKYGVSMERICQIKKAALEKMQKTFASYQITSSS